VKSPAKKMASSKPPSPHATPQVRHRQVASLGDEEKTPQKHLPQPPFIANEDKVTFFF